MNTQRDTIPSAWVWSHYRGSLGDNAEEVAPAWVWSQYGTIMSVSEIQVTARKSNKWSSKILYVLAISVLILGALYSGSLNTNSSHEKKNQELANDQISEALDFLKGAYKITPRDETEKLIIQIEKILKK